MKFVSTSTDIVEAIKEAIWRAGPGPETLLLISDEEMHPIAKAFGQYGT